MLRKAVISYLLKLTDEQFSALIARIRLARMLKRDGVEESKNSFSLVVTVCPIVKVVKKAD